MKLCVSLMLILSGVCICKSSAKKENDTVLGPKVIDAFINEIRRQSGLLEVLNKIIQEIRKNQQNETTEGEEGILSPTTKLATQGQEKEATITMSKPENRPAVSTKRQITAGTLAKLKVSVKSSSKEPTTIEVPPTIINTKTKVEPPTPSTKSTTKESITTRQTPPNLKATTTSDTKLGTSNKLSTKEPSLNSTTKGISMAIGLEEIDAFLNKIMSRQRVKELLKKKIIQEIKKNQQNGTTEGEEGILSPTTKLATQGQGEEATITMSKPENRPAVSTKRQTTAGSSSVTANDLDKGGLPRKTSTGSKLKPITAPSTESSEKPTENPNVELRTSSPPTSGKMPEKQDSSDHGDEGGQSSSSVEKLKALLKPFPRGKSSSSDVDDKEDESDTYTNDKSDSISDRLQSSSEGKRNTSDNEGEDTKSNPDDPKPLCRGKPDSSDNEGQDTKSISDDSKSSSQEKPDSSNNEGQDTKSNPDDPKPSSQEKPDSSDNEGQDAESNPDDRKLAFFLTSIVMVFAACVVYHNRQEIIKIIIEGKDDRGSRGRGYRKLETNVEEAIPSMKSANSSYAYWNC